MTTFYTASGVPSAATRYDSTPIRAEFVLIQTGFAAVDAAIAAVNSGKGSIAGQAWAGNHDFTGASYIRVPAPVNAMDAVTKSYADNLAITAVTPAQPGGGLTYHLSSTVGVASWVADTLFATSAEIKTGSSAVKMIAPSTALAAFGFSAYFQSADQTITSGGLLTIAHGLGRTPIIFHAFLKNVTAQADCVTGDITPVQSWTNYDGTQPRGVAIIADATNIYVRYSGATNVFRILSRTSANDVLLTNANWSFFVRALA